VLHVLVQPAESAESLSDKPKTKQQPGGAAPYADSLTRYLVVYVCILALAGLQFVIAYRHIGIASMILRMFAIALLHLMMIRSGCTRAHPDLSCSLFPVDELIEAFIVGRP
jgi:hypothetical protein